MLEGIDVHSVGDVRHLGIPLVMRILRQRGLSASMYLTYALEAGLNDQHWLELDPDTKQELREACQDEG